MKWISGLRCLLVCVLLSVALCGGGITARAEESAESVVTEESDTGNKVKDSEVDGDENKVPEEKEEETKEPDKSEKKGSKKTIIRLVLVAIVAGASVTVWFQLKDKKIVTVVVYAVAILVAFGMRKWLFICFSLELAAAPFAIWTVKQYQRNGPGKMVIIHAILTALHLLMFAFIKWQNLVVLGIVGVAMALNTILRDTSDGSAHSNAESNEGAAELPEEEHERQEPPKPEPQKPKVDWGDGISEEEAGVLVGVAMAFLRKKKETADTEGTDEAGVEDSVEQEIHNKLMGMLTGRQSVESPEAEDNPKEEEERPDPFAAYSGNKKVAGPEIEDVPLWKRISSIFHR